MREGPPFSGRVENGLDAVACFAPPHVDKSESGIGIGVRQPLGVPGDFLDAVLQEIVFVEQCPDGVDALPPNAAAEQDFARLAALFVKQQLPVDRVFEAAA